MRKEINLKVKEKFINKYKKGYPLIYINSIEYIDKKLQEGSIINLVDERGKFVARGYYGIQNKGVGWVLTRKENESIDLEFFQKKLIVALNKRSKFFEDSTSSAFRIFNGEGDGVGGLTIEYFDGYYVINWYSKGIYTFKEQIINALKKMVLYKGIYQKKRFSEEGKYIEEDDFVTGKRADQALVVKENGVNIAVYLNEGAMLGVFLDQRQVRKRIREHYSENKRVLNTFSYTGIFSVFAALGGASKTTSVDLANRSFSKTVEQFNINNINPAEHEIIVEDVFKYFQYAIKKELKYDLVILDPPSFATSKNFKFSAEKDYKDLLKQAILITEKNGTILASTNSSAFNMAKFKEFIKQAFNESNIRYQILEEYTLPSDFKTIEAFEEGNYLKVAFIKKMF